METNNAIIRETDVREILETNVPGLQIDQSKEDNLFKVIDGFADFTIELIKKGNLPAIKNCFSIAENMLVKGSSSVKLGIENIYVFSVTIFFDMGHAVSKQVKELLPSHLKEEYHKQVSSINS